MNKYQKYMVNLLENECEYILANELNDKLCNQFKINSDNARKIIQRTCVGEFIFSSKPMTFGNGQFAYFSSRDFLTRKNVEMICKNYRPPVYRLLNQMHFNSGIISFYEAVKITASPLQKTSSKVSLINDIIDDLVELELIVKEKDQFGTNFLLFTEIDKKSDLIIEHKNNMKIDSLIIPDILKFLQNQNLIDNQIVRYRSRTNPSIGAEHNSLLWDAFAYTKSTGIHRNYGKNAKDSVLFEKKTLVVLDIVISRDYSENDLKGFMSRIDIILNSVKRGVRKVIPIIVFSDISNKLMNEIKALGILCITLGTVYGEHIYKVMTNLKLINLSFYGKDIYEVDRIEVINETLKLLKTSGQESNLQNLKGDMFEMIVLNFLQQIYPNVSIVQGRIIKDQSLNYEYDFIIENSNGKEIILVEAKGYKKSDKIKLGDYQRKNTVKWFFNKTLPFAMKNIEYDKKRYKICACYITTAFFEEDAIEFLLKLNSGKLKSSRINVYYDRKDLINKMKELDMNKSIEIIENYYI